MILLFASTASVEAFRSGTENLCRNIPSRSKICKHSKVESLDQLIREVYKYMLLMKRGLQLTVGSNQAITSVLVLVLLWFEIG